VTGRKDRRAARRRFLYEHRGEPLLDRRAFALRLARHLAAAVAVLAVSLAGGVVGYRWTEGMPWLDALLNAAMILSGMGPVDTLRTEAGKLFASGYAIFSGVAFLAVAGVVLAPALHRLLHRFHLDEED
jgi:hypothetical protein